MLKKIDMLIRFSAQKPNIFLSLIIGVLGEVWGV